MINRIVPTIAVLIGLPLAAQAFDADMAPQAIPEGITLVDADAAQTANASRKTFIVLLDGEPAIRYDGGEAGFAATAPAPGDDYDALASHVQMYTRHLTSKHDELLAALGASQRKLYSYSHTMNGFAAELTQAEVAALSKRADVLSVFQDYSYEINTSSTSDFLGLTDFRDGLRNRLGLKGEDVVIGVIDTGAVPQHPSFADTRDFALPSFCDDPRHSWQKRICGRLEKLRERVVYDPPEDWNGVCEVGDGSWSEADCNNKLIGARFYVDGFLAGQGALDEDEFISPRDSSGHGSHVASTAGGNSVRANVSGTEFGRIVGMAPRARIAVYKACWLAPGAPNFTCFFSDTAAATEDAVLDGVDVLNFSVGTALTFVDQQDLAFFDATAAGVFVARSAGNDGPGFATTNAGEPWVTSVAASTTDGPALVLGIRVNEPASVAGTYRAVEGAITTALSVTGPITGNLTAADPVNACGAGLNNDIAGNIALIARGVCGFDEKVGNAVAAGASAVIVYSDDRPLTVMGGDSSNPIPGVMIENAAGLALLAELQAGATVNATLAEDIVTEIEREGNIMANFSSRGPYTFEEDFLKPDITAPGVTILAADSPDQADGSTGGLFGNKSGTSMSSPHIAGLAALIREARPDWSPAQVKSALMTTARQDVAKEDGTTPGDPFDFGAGHVVPNDAVSPALTYDVGALDYAIASCATNAADTFPGVSFCTAVEDLGLGFAPADLNLPSIAIGSLPGTQTVTRTVTAVADFEKPRLFWWWGKTNDDSGPREYVARVDAPPGFSVDVSPSSLYLAPGESATYELTISNDTAPPESWQFGAVTWESQKGNDVRSPIAVKASAFVTEDNIVATGSDGAASFDLTFGYTGDYTAGVHGINETFLQPLVLADGEGAGFDFGTGVSGTDFSYFAGFLPPVAPGTAAIRVSTYEAYTAGGSADDIDLYLYYCPNFSCSLVDSSTSPAGFDETVEVQFPVPDAGPAGVNPYLLFVHAFDMASPVTDLVTFTGQFGVVDDAGNFSVTAPSFGNVGETVSIDTTWTGLPTGAYDKQLGAISHSDPNGVQALTVFDFQNDPGESICSGDARAELEAELGRGLVGCPAP